MTSRRTSRRTRSRMDERVDTARCRRRGAALSSAQALAWFAICVLLGALASGAAAQVQPVNAPPPSEQGLPGTVSGQVMDHSGAAIVGALVKLTRDDGSPSQEVLAGDIGQFSFVDIPPGPFHITISAANFAPQTFSGTLRPGEVQVVPPIEMAVATAVTEVHVAALTTVEIAQVQIEDQEKQRVLGFMPNFYVSYDPHAAPLVPRQKFELAWKTTLDPVTFLFIGVTAGIQQSQNTNGGYGQGAQGYGKRFGAGFGDTVSNNFIGGAILASLFKQDPRYFYKGTGSKRSRALYAIANAVICKGDNGRWQPGYSGVLGSLVSGGISLSYSPSNDRTAGLVFENTAIGIGATAAANLFQEFIVKKLTPGLSKRNQNNTSTP